MPDIESRYISNIDRSKIEKDPRGQGDPAEEIVVNFFNENGYETRFSTKSEDSGVTDIGQRQIIDAVTYYEGRPAMGLQITTSASREIRAKKLAEIKEKPFLRLDEMKPKDSAIPRVLIYLDSNQVGKFKEDANFTQHPEIALQILDSAINSLKFDLSQTKNPSEQNAVTQLIQNLEQEKKKYIH